MEELPLPTLHQAVRDFVESNRLVVLRAVQVSLAANQERAIHEMRVATKKLRTIYRMVERVSDGKFRQKNEIKPLRKLFRAAGGLRELHVHAHVLHAYESMHVAFYRHFSQLIGMACRAERPGYERARLSYSPETLSRSNQALVLALEGISEEILKQGIVEMAQTRLSGALESLPPGYDPERIHKARILIKEAMYLIGLLQVAGIQDAFDGPMLAGAKAAAEIAGEWHDREVFDQWLQGQIQQGNVGMTVQRQSAFLLQDLHLNTRAMARRFKESVSALAQAHMARS